MTECFFWIPFIELIYAIGFIIVMIFNFIVDYWWAILIFIAICVLITNLANKKNNHA